MIGDDIGSWPVSQTSAENFHGNQEREVSENTYEKDHTQGGDTSFEFPDQNMFSDQKMSSRGGLRERMAARAGFSAPMLNTESIRSADSALKSDVRSPYLSIPPGLSPACLLESPVFLSNSLVQPSPTTGKFSFAPGGDFRSSTLTLETPEKTKNSLEDTYNTSSFSFKPVADMPPSHFFNAGPRVNPSTHPQHAYPIIETSIQSANTLQSQSAEPAKFESQNGASYQLQADFYGMSTDNDVCKTTSMSESRALVNIDDDSDHSPPEEQQHDEANARGSEDSMVADTASDDGYNWRKYGQKQVKGSEFPRSYYKCTHSNCPVKKKVERSHEGHITEIIYKGTHNHPKPPPNRKSMIGCTNLVTDSQTGADGNTVWTTTMQKDAGAAAPGWRHDSLEVTSSAAVGAQFNGPHFETGAQNGSSNFSNEEDDQGTHGSASVGYDEGIDESESKRRKIEAYATDLSGSTRAIREPRVVVQTTSEVDILDDGYRWRKYGQKVVKGNPNPRSYYKCTSSGCNVRKHVERASHDLKSVITTYEGKHNHDVPAARNSSQATAANSGYGGGGGGGAAPNQLRRPEPSQIHNGMSRFEIPSSVGMQQLGPPPPYGFAYGMNQAGLGNMGMGEWPYQQQGRLQQSGNGMGLMLPKGEPKVEPLPEPPLNVLPNGYSL